MRKLILISLCFFFSIINVCLIGDILEFMELLLEIEIFYELCVELVKLIGGIYYRDYLY